MRKVFPEYTGIDKRYINRIWRSCLVTFDTNVLLNLYRYPFVTSTQYLSLLEQKKDRVWLSHQTALEYYRNRFSVVKSYEEQQKRLVNEIKQTYQKLKEHLGNKDYSRCLNPQLRSKLKSELENKMN